jgi:hypothetical protein
LFEYGETLVDRSLHPAAYHSDLAPIVPRATKDLDVFVRSDEENSKAVFRALAQYGAALEGLTPSDFMDGLTFQIGQPPARIDILQHIDGSPNRRHLKRRSHRNKLATGREQDTLDVKKLRAARQE